MNNLFRVVWFKLLMYDLLKPIVVSGGLILQTLRGRVENKEKESDLADEFVQPSSTAHTIADDLIQEIALEILHARYPDMAINAEEDTTRVELFDTDKSNLCFHLDPLDGTLAYTQGRDDFAVGAAISLNLEFIASAIYFPAKDRLYYAERGEGVRIENALGEKIEFNRPDIAEKKYVHKRCEQFQPIYNKLDYSKLDSMSAHNTMIALVEGRARFQLYQHASPHDFGIPQVILEESGGICCDENGDDITYDEQFTRLPYFFAFFDESEKQKFFEMKSILDL